MKSKMETKICGVCGDKALGHNFNALSCESCKAFFRRNALTSKTFKCPFNNQCEITTITRRFCQKCRLDKCIAIGMCKDLIMTEEDKVAKRKKIQENRVKRQYSNGFKKGFKKIKKENGDSQESEYASSVYNTDSDSKDTNISEQAYHPNNENLMTFSQTDITFVPNNTDENIASPTERLVSSSDDISASGTVLSPPNCHQINQQSSGSETKYTVNSVVRNNNEFSCSNSVINDSNIMNARENMDYITQDVVSDVQRLNNEPTTSSIESILCEAIKLEYEAFYSVSQFNSNSRELNDAERAKLNELIVAHKALSTPVDNELNGLNGLFGDEIRFQTNSQQNEANPVLVNVINLTAICIRRLIKMAKKISAFKNMCQEDQIALLKGGCTEIMLLRSALHYDAKQHTWQIPHSHESLNVNVDVLKLCKNNMYQMHEKFIKTFDPKWRSDENIILIMCAVVLFTPNRPRVIHQDVIKLEQNSYFYLLRRYLESIYTGCEAKSTFLKLIQKISDLRKANEELIHVYLNVNPSQLWGLTLAHPAELRQLTVTTRNDTAILSVYQIISREEMTDKFMSLAPGLYYENYILQY